MSGISSSDRKNWNTPFVFDPDNPQILYYGANRLYKTTNRAVSWQAISPDLTNGSAGGLVVYGTITAIAVASSNSQFIYVGTDDGNVWRTFNGGTDWIKIDDGLPLRWVTRVAVDPFDEDIVYVTLSGYRYDSYLPHVFRSENAGETWDDISGNLPEAPVNDLIVDPANTSTLYLATDFGVFMTYDLGQHWAMPGTNLPNVPIVDLDFHQPTRTLIAATYGRSMYSFNVDQLVSVTENTSREGYFEVFPNPAQGEINLQTNLASDAEFFITNIKGQTLLKGVLQKGQSAQKIDISGLPSGFYSIRILTKNQILQSTFTKP
jgi:hypothetical protein